MDITKYYGNPDEKPLDNIVDDGGFAAIFRTIGCIGDSLSSGEFETYDEEGIKGYHDFYEYSWGQFMARTLGNKVYNFSRGGMSAKWFCDSFSADCGVYKYENLCQAYIIALGVNDLTGGCEIGDIEKISVSERCDPKDESIMAYYSAIVRTIKSKQPDAKFFFMTIPYNNTLPAERIAREDELAEAIRKFADKTKNCYVLDFRKYAPVHDQKFNDTFKLGHMTATGYLLMSKMIMSYIDWIIRNNPDDFAQVGFIGTPYKYRKDLI